MGPREIAARQANLLDRILSHENTALKGIDLTKTRRELQENGLPYPGKGRWEHSDVTGLINEAFKLVEPSDSVTETRNLRIASIDSNSVAHDCSASKGLTIECSLPMVLVNRLLCHGGANLSVHSQQTAAYLRLAAAPHSIDRYVVDVGSKSNLNVDEQFTGGNRVVFVRVQSGASLSYSLSGAVSDHKGYHALVLALEEDANFNLQFASQGGALRRHEIVLDINGKNSEADMSGGWWLKNRSHLDLQVYSNHKVGESTSNQRFHGVVDDHSRAYFNGSIKIGPRASATEAHLSNRNIALSPYARTGAQPDLEIYTDDVICSHGVTSGELADDVLFLLKSRGIDPEIARDMLIRGFLRQVIDTASGSNLLNL